MKKLIFPTMIFLIILLVGLEIGLAQQYMIFKGEVVDIHRRAITVKGEKGEVMVFAIGRRTVYTPARLPVVGEKVEVSYLLRRGRNVAYQMKIFTPDTGKK